MASVRPSRASAAALWILAVLVAVFFLRSASQLLIPVVLGVLISYALEPVVAWLEQHYVPRLAGAALVLLLIVGVAGWGVYSLRDDFVSATEALPEAARRARDFLTSSKASRPAANIQQAAEELSERPPQAAGDQASGTSGTVSRETANRQQAREAPQADKQGATSENGGAAGSAVSGAVQRAVGSVIALAGHIAVVFFLVFFLLASGNHFRRRLVEIAGPQLERRRITATVIDDINGQIQRFLLVRLVTSIVVAVATWVVLAWMQVEQAAVWGILAGIFNSVPYFGPVIVSGGLLVVGLVQSGDAMEAVKISGAALVITSLEGWLLTPPLMGKAEHMSAVVIFLGVLLWTWIWGPWGTILAVPMMVVVKSIADHVEALKPVSRLMAP
jgi:predicted PurR-regulated permease PerM